MNKRKVMAPAALLSALVFGVVAGCQSRPTDPVQSAATGKSDQQKVDSGSPERPQGPTVDFDGVWTNELGSKMTLKVTKDGKVTGTYHTAVGAPNEKEEFPVTGFAAGDQLSFAVNFGKYGSQAAWVGQHTVDETGKKPVIKTMWVLSKDVPDEEEGKKLWGSVLMGYNNFTR